MTRGSDTPARSAHSKRPGPATNHASGTGPGQAGDNPRNQPAEIVGHLVVALSRYLRQLRLEGALAPAQLEELVILLANRANQCQDVPSDKALLDRSRTPVDRSLVPGRLLLTKCEAAELLGISLRSFERLVSAGCLPLVHLQGAARVRVADLETYVKGLSDDYRSDPARTDE